MCQCPLPVGLPAPYHMQFDNLSFHTLRPIFLPPFSFLNLFACPRQLVVIFFCLRSCASGQVCLQFCQRFQYFTLTPPDPIFKFFVFPLTVSILLKKLRRISSMPKQIQFLFPSILYDSSSADSGYEMP